jgi:hypothetical protein
VPASVTAGRGSIRRSVRIAVPPDDVWAMAGDRTRLAEWFPGIVACTVDGTTRVVTTASGIAMPEQIVTDDRLQRRFQYRITAPIVSEHLSTLDVIDLGDGTSLVVYAVDCDPATMALILGGAAGHALEHLRQLLEAKA